MMHMSVLAHRSRQVLRKGPRLSAQSGMTIVELLVAMVISMLIALAAVSALVVTRRGFTTVDSAAQLRDNARFAADLVQRIGMQAGFKDPAFVTRPPSSEDLVNDAAGLIPSAISGFNNSLFNTNLTAATARTTGTTGYGSDILILRYQSSTRTDTSGATIADGSMIDCAGNSATTVAATRNDRMVSVFHVATDTDGEPSLMCTYSTTGAAPFTTVPLVRGVENFQVLYGVSGFTAVNTAFTPIAVNTNGPAEKYLRADQIIVGGSTTSQATTANWRNVRSIRIGMVLRGPLNSQQEKVSQTFYPFGNAPSASGGSAGSSLSSSSDAGTIFTPTTDGRLRQVSTFTIHLRNDQTL